MPKKAKKVLQRINLRMESLPCDGKSEKQEDVRTVVEIFIMIALRNDQGETLFKTAADSKI